MDDPKPITADEIRKRMKALGAAAREELRRRGVPEAEIQKTLIPRPPDPDPDPPRPAAPRVNVKA
jgi:hypothetical protein